MSRKAEIEQWAQRIRDSVHGSGNGDWPDEHGVERLLIAFEREVAEKVSLYIQGELMRAAPTIEWHHVKDALIAVIKGDWRKGSK